MDIARRVTAPAAGRGRRAAADRRDAAARPGSDADERGTERSGPGGRRERRPAGLRGAVQALRAARQGLPDARAARAAATAEELAQEAMVSVWRKAASFDPARAGVSTWIFTIARNLRIDRHRRGGDADVATATTPTVDRACPTPTAPPPDEQLDARAARAPRARRRCAGSRRSRRSVLHLSYFAEQPHAEIARELGIPLGTVKSRIRLAVINLRRLHRRHRTMIHHHPDDALLMALAAGRLARGPAVVTASPCRGLRALPRAPARVRGGRRRAARGSRAGAARAARRWRGRWRGIDAGTRARTGRAPAPAPRATRFLASLPAGMAWPRSLRGCTTTRWRWLGPGMRWSRVTLRRRPAANVFLLRIAAGKSLPVHTHAASS